MTEVGEVFHHGSEKRGLLKINKCVYQAQY